MARATFQLVKGSDVLPKMRALRQAPARSATEAARAHGPRVVAAARALTPRRTGRLAASLRFEVEQERNGKVTLTLIGGEGLGVYAQVQHEDLSLKHDDGQAKFLEGPFVRMADEFEARQRALMDREIDRA